MCSLFLSGYTNTIFVFFRSLYLLLKSFEAHRSIYSESNYASLIKLYLEELSFPQIGIDYCLSVLADELVNNGSSSSKALLEMQNNVSIRLHQQYYDDCRERLGFHGIASTDSIIVLHVRSSHYHSDSGRREFRNASILNYLPLIEYLASGESKVVIIGDSFQNEIPPIQNVIDLRFGAPGKPCSLDVLLISICTTYIGMMSGPLDVAILFSKKTIVLNAYLLGYCYGYPCNTVYLLKNHTTVSNGRRIYGASGLYSDSIRLARIQDSTIDSYSIEELSSREILCFVMYILGGEARAKSYQKMLYRDITAISRAEGDVILQELCDLASAGGLKYRSYLRHCVNHMLSLESVSVYECV